MCKQAQEGVFQISNHLEQYFKCCTAPGSPALLMLFWKYWRGLLTTQMGFSGAVGMKHRSSSRTSVLVPWTSALRPRRWFWIFIACKHHMPLLGPYFCTLVFWSVRDVSVLFLLFREKGVSADRQTGRQTMYKEGKWEIEGFLIGHLVKSIKVANCPWILAFLSLPTEWPTFCQNSWMGMRLFFMEWNKLNFHFSNLSFIELPKRNERTSKSGSRDCQPSYKKSSHLKQNVFSHNQTRSLLIGIFGFNDDHLRSEERSANTTKLNVDFLGHNICQFTACHQFRTQGAFH